MSAYIEEKYLLLISSRLERFSKKKDDLYNFRCPYCGDSKRSKFKCRGFVYRRNDSYYYICHNCSASTTFSSFLKYIDPILHKQFVFERYKNDGVSTQKALNITQLKSVAKKYFTKKAEQRLNLPSISSLENDHPAKMYLSKRKIPQKYFSEIYYTENLVKFVQENYPDHAKNLSDDARIILPAVNANGEITHLIARSLDKKSQLRYVIVQLKDDYKIYGLNRIDSKKTVYLVEGQFDSMFVDNCVASGDSNLIGLYKYLSESHNIDDCVLIFDKEPRNKQIVSLMERAINIGCRVCIFPNSLHGKDINEMILMNDTVDINTIIKENTYSGLIAKLKFNDWKRT